MQPLKASPPCPSAPRAPVQVLLLVLGTLLPLFAVWVNIHDSRFAWYPRAALEAPLVDLFAVACMQACASLFFIPPLQALWTRRLPPLGQSLSSFRMDGAQDGVHVREAPLTFLALALGWLGAGLTMTAWCCLPLFRS